MRRLRQYGIGLAHIVPLLFLLYSYSPLPHPDTVFYNMPSPLLQNKNILPLPNTLSTQLYVSVYLKSDRLLNHFLPVITEPSFNPPTSSQYLFENYHKIYAGYTRQIYELSLYLKLHKGLTTFLAQQPVPIPYTTEGLAEKFRALLNAHLILGIDNNPLYFKTHLTNMLQELLNTMPNVPTRTVLLNPEFTTAVVFPAETVVMPALPYPSLSTQERATHLKEMAEHINWRLLIAGTKQQIETALIFDNREPGCLVAMAKAFKYAIKTLDEPLSLQHVITTHHLCVENVSGNINVEQKKHPEQPFRQNPNPVGYTLYTATASNMTPEGKKELCFYQYSDKDYTFREGYHQSMLYGPSLQKRMEEILTQYNRNIEKSTNPQQKLQHIVSTMSLLERVHPFWDANGRTFCTILLNRELLRHGFPVTVLEDPNYCDGYSTPEFMQEVVNGFENYHYIKEHGHFRGESAKKASPENTKLIASLEFMQAVNHWLENYRYAKEHSHRGEPVTQEELENQKLIAQLKTIFLEAADVVP